MMVAKPIEISRKKNKHTEKYTYSLLLLFISSPSLPNGGGGGELAFRG